LDLPILLIGPMAAGKTTIARYLAQKLGLVQHELDDRRWDYYNEIGYDPALAAQIHSQKGLTALARGYWKPFEIHAVERGLADFADGVISFGAGHSVYEDDVQFERIQRLLAPYKNVILLLPCADLDESAAILKERYIAQEPDIEPDPQALEMIDFFLRDPSNQRLAKQVIYTKGKSPEETCEEVIQQLS
jgi:shikimate kinase